jgi:hypothetical protein
MRSFARAASVQGVGGAARVTTERWHFFRNLTESEQQK